MRNVIGWGLIVVVMGLGCWRQAGPSAPAVKVYEREEFKKAVDGKTQDEVKAMLGTPYRTSDTGPDSTWNYENITRDAVTDKVDSDVWIRFRGGKVNNVHF